MKCQKIDRRGNIPPQLGYRGIAVMIGADGRYLEFYKGVAFDGSHYYKDADQKIEKWLINSGKSHVKDIHDLIGKMSIPNLNEYT